jgi:class 3 adenylate cyclase
MDPGRARVGHPRSPRDPRAGKLTAASAAYRGHLFSDLRGYTSFIERAGNAAGAELIEDYRRLVRNCVAEHGGAEVKTEGDSFYVVFPSASSAVMCGIAIVDAAEDANKARPDRPMQIGIGIHVGEVVETDQTFIGSAVNVAARVCAVAKPGEVLVTSTVRGVTQGSIPVTFKSRGKKRLKGIADPVELYAVTDRAEGAVETQRIPRWGIALAGGLAAVLVLGAYSFIGQPGAKTGPTSAATLVASAPPLVVGNLPIGEYRAREFLPAFSVLIGEPDWQAYKVQSDAIGLTRNQAPLGNLDIGKVRGVLTEPCNPEGAAVSAGDTPEELMDAVKDVLYLHPNAEKELTVGDYEGKSITFTVDPGAKAACGGFGPGDVSVFKIGTENWSVTPGEMVTLRALDVNGETISVLLSGDDPTGSVEATSLFFDRADLIVQSLKF